MNFAAMTLLCLGFSTGFLLVVSFIEKPILPVVAMPHTAREHESDVRWIHSYMQGLINFAGVNVLLPVMLLAVLMSVIQSMHRGYDVVSVFVAVGTAILAVIALLVIAPAARHVRDSRPYEDDIEQVAGSLFRLVRMHQTTLLSLIPLTFAQLALLFY